MKQGTPARVVAVSSELHRKGALDLADLHFRQRKYSGMASYGEPVLIRDELMLTSTRIEGGWFGQMG